MSKADHFVERQKFEFTCSEKINIPRRTIYLLRRTAWNVTQTAITAYCVRSPFCRVLSVPLTFIPVHPC